MQVKNLVLDLLHLWKYKFHHCDCKIRLSHCSLFLVWGQASDIGLVVAFEGFLMKSCLSYLQ